MAINTIPISARTIGLDPRVTANGSYTLPQYAFIPHPDLQPMSRGMIPNPGIPSQSAQFMAVPGIQQRPYPTPQVPVYGIRQVQLKIANN